MEDILNKIDGYIKSADVVLFLKGTKDQPMCGFSAFVVNLLKRMNVDFVDINVLDDHNIREGIKQFSSWPTIPQLYIKQEFIGGCDIAKQMYQSGELYQTLERLDVPYTKIA